MKKLIWLVIGIALVILVISLILVKKVEAKPPTHTPIPTPEIQCKHENAECNVNSSSHKCCAGLVCVAFNRHSDNGKCEEIESIPTASPSATPTVEPTATPTPECVEDCQTPTPEPTVTPEPSKEPVMVESGTTEAGAPVCGDTAPAKVPNIFVTNAGVGKLEVRWVPTGGDKAHIFYGLEVGKPLFSLIDTPNDGVEVIGSLESGKHYWFAVVNGSGCAWSSLSNWYDPIVE